MTQLTNLDLLDGLLAGKTPEELGFTQAKARARNGSLLTKAEKDENKRLTRLAKANKLKKEAQESMPVGVCSIIHTVICSCGSTQRFLAQYLLKYMVSGVAYFEDCPVSEYPLANTLSENTKEGVSTTRHTEQRVLACKECSDL